MHDKGAPVFGAIWDLDGTLVDTEMNHYAAWRALLREHGRELTHAAFRPTFGLRNDDILVNTFGFDPDPVGITRLAERKEEFFRQSLRNDGVRTQPGARELVAHLHALGARQAIASSAPPANIALTMALLGMRDRFEAIVSGEEVARGKPAPDIFLRAAEHLGLAPARAVVLEDAPAGVAAGRAAGARVIAIASTFPAASLGEADLVVSSFMEILWPLERWERFFAR
jgi:beta-phosphoglucomutase